MKSKFLNKEYLIHSLKQYKYLGIITSMLLIVLGILMFYFPLISNIIAIWTFIIGLLLVGLFDLFAYLFGNKDNKKSSFILLKAITNIVVSLLILIPMIINSIEIGFKEAITDSTLSFISWVVVFFGIYLIFTGLGRIFRSSVIEVLGGSRSVEIIIGVTYIFLGLLFCINPAINTITFITYILGIYLISYGIILFIELITSPTIRDYSKPFTPKKAKDGSKNEEVTVEIIDNDKLEKK